MNSGWWKSDLPIKGTRITKVEITTRSTSFDEASGAIIDVGVTRCGTLPENLEASKKYTVKCIDGEISGIIGDYVQISTGRNLIDKKLSFT